MRHVLVDPAAAPLPRAAGRSDAEGRDQDVGRIEPAIQGNERHEAAQQQPGAGQKDQGQRDLHDGQHGLPRVRPQPAEAAAGAAL